MTLTERFLSHVDGAPGFGPEGNCWRWTAQTHRGYGRFQLDGRPMMAHRASYLLFRGPIPKGLEARHTCLNRLCVNPDHIEPGTKFDNAADGLKAGRTARGRRLPQAVLTEAKVQAIRRRYAAGGVSQGALAREYGVCQATIGLVLRWKTWTHC
jgi:hypothetical protein